METKTIITPEPRDGRQKVIIAYEINAGEYHSEITIVPAGSVVFVQVSDLKE